MANVKNYTKLPIVLPLSDTLAEKLFFPPGTPLDIAGRRIVPSGSQLYFKDGVAHTILLRRLLNEQVLPTLSWFNKRSRLDYDIESFDSRYVTIHFREAWPYRGYPHHEIYRDFRKDEQYWKEKHPSTLAVEIFAEPRREQIVLVVQFLTSRPPPALKKLMKLYVENIHEIDTKERERAAKEAVGRAEVLRDPTRPGAYNRGAVFGPAAVNPRPNLTDRLGEDPMKLIQEFLGPSNPEPAAGILARLPKGGTRRRRGRSRSRSRHAS